MNTYIENLLIIERVKFDKDGIVSESCKIVDVQTTYEEVLKTFDRLAKRFGVKVSDDFKEMQEIGRWSPSNKHIIINDWLYYMRDDYYSIDPNETWCGRKLGEVPNFGEV